MKNKLNIRVAVFFIGLFLSMIAVGKSSDVSSNSVDLTYSLIVGKPYKIKYSRQLNGNQVVLAAKYVAYFKDYQVVHGKLNKKLILKVELQASSKLAISYYDEIFVVVVNSDKNILESVKWGEPIHRVCMYEDEISRFGMSNTFGNIKRENNISCASLYSHSKK